MTRVLPRTNFHSSTLMRCLADLSLVDAAATAPGGNAFAEKLGQWVHFTDAITLSAVHGDGTDKPTRQATSLAGLPAGLPAAVVDEVIQVQAGLTESISTSCRAQPGKLHIRLPEPLLALPSDAAAACTPYRRFYEAHQRDMEMRLQPLRRRVRAALAQVSPALRKLAELDAALETILCERERLLLATVPALLGKRFEQALKAHRQRLHASPQEDPPASWMQAGGWLAGFCHDLQALLLAELELRLQPTLGLIDAAGSRPGPPSPLSQEPR